jgi:poly(beta-D-mannuronate) lyase
VWPGSGDRFDTGATVPVSPGLDTLVDGVARAKSGDIVVLASGEYPVSRTIVVDKPVTVRGEGEVRITFERTALFEIVDGGSLKLVGVKISGAEAPDVAGNAAIRTSRYSMLNNYALVVEGSVVEDLDTNHSFNFFALAKHTFADRIEIRNSTFRNVTGSILALNREDDDLGIYNGEYIRIDNSEFRKVRSARTSRCGRQQSATWERTSATSQKRRFDCTGCRRPTSTTTCSWTAGRFG